mmetsp:Transcript_16119/g.29323  ORF Transcript_16119/g.29323 Transcript_16119/m.29323 type:complete len:99 (+) Transcript_16119:373-669(+)
MGRKQKVEASFRCLSMARYKPVNMREVNPHHLCDHSTSGRAASLVKRRLVPVDVRAIVEIVGFVFVSAAAHDGVRAEFQTHTTSRTKQLFTCALRVIG